MGDRARRLKAFAIGAFLGLIPGAILVLLAVPVSGEIELTLGAFGIQLGALGFLIGGLVGAMKA